MLPLTHRLTPERPWVAIRIRSNSLISEVGLASNELRGEFNSLLAGPKYRSLQKYRRDRTGRVWSKFVFNFGRKKNLMGRDERG